MSGATSRLKSLLGQLGGSQKPPTPPASPAPAQAPAAADTAVDNEYTHNHHLHQLTPTFFLERAASIEPDATAIYHVTANNRVLRRSYMEFADRARGLAYYLQKRGHRRVGVLATNTPAFLESIYGVAAAGGIIVPVNYRLKPADITYIFDFAEVDAIIVDQEYVALLDEFRAGHADVPLILGGEFDEAVLEGLKHDVATGARGWAGLYSQRCAGGDEDATIAIPFTSGTTSRPKGVVMTHRGAYLASLANIIESGLNYNGTGRCRYLWTLPIWSVTAVRGTHYCLRKIDYPLIWKLLKEEKITHFNAAPTVNTLLCASPEAEKLPEPVKVTVAASPPTAHLFEQMTDLNLQPVHVYGMTETYGPITKGYPMPAWDALPLPEKYAKMARQGHGFVTSLPIRVVKTDQPDENVLVDVAKDGKEIGEIVFFGNICAKGYYKDPEATRKLFLGGGCTRATSRSGIRMGARRSRIGLRISSSANISSVALESMLVQHPDVLEAGVVAVPDSHWGERPKAYITVKENRQIEGQDLIDWAKSQSAISKFMVPREVEVVRELPKTSTGKIQKNVLREWSKKGQHRT
ncbi:2-succinylbenzoate-CoA ligase [Apiospora hydei]|uniref:2-succinylbenzoate-CoA ligase n=1 Tax=Apiospora hydei TaxID=1337664 RepID=A0ABR1UQ27_9PEZI